MSRFESILSRIEKLRDKMHRTADQYGISSRKTLIISQMLDEALNEYYGKKAKGVKEDNIEAKAS